MAVFFTHFLQSMRFHYAVVLTMAMRGRRLKKNQKNRYSLGGVFYKSSQKPNLAIHIKAFSNIHSDVHVHSNYDPDPVWLGKKGTPSCLNNDINCSYFCKLNRITIVYLNLLIKLVNNIL